jgi:hypothetical protein
MEECCCHVTELEIKNIGHSMMQLEKLCGFKEHFKKELKIEEQFKPTTCIIHHCN